MSYITAYDIQIGDLFCEDTFPEVWKAITPSRDGVIAECVGYQFPSRSWSQIGRCAVFAGREYVQPLYKVDRYYTPDNVNEYPYSKR